MTQDSENRAKGRTRHPLAFYSFLYGLVIFGFAWLFWLMPGQFYHSTSMHEPQLKPDAVRIKNGIESAMIDQFKKHGPKDSLFIGEYEVELDSLKVNEMNYDKKMFAICVGANTSAFCAVSPDILIDPHATSSWEFKTLGSGETAITAHVDFGPVFPAASVEDDIDDDQKTITSRKSHFRRPYWHNDLFTVKGTDGANYVGVFVVSDDLRRLMQGYADAQEGFAGQATGSFGRMLYLSTVTITTLGYGDIVPITPLARTLIAIEAVVGMIVIGLYLSALTKRVEKT